MIDRQVLLRLIESCNIYFEGSLISKELIIQKYVDFFATSITSEDHSFSVAIHTGSLCFDIMSFIIVAIACITIDQTDPVEIISSLTDGDMILYKNERYRWRGLEIMHGMTYMKLEQDGRGKNGRSTKWCPLETNKGLVKPYNGASDITDGRGIRRKKTNRSDFISYITGKEISDIPSVTGVSAVIVAERTSFDRIQRGTRIDYDEGKSIRLLDIVPASYYSDSNETYQFGSNPSKEEPVLKIAGKVSIARELVLDKYGNKVVGLIVIGSDAISKGFSELEDLLHRKSLKFTHVTMSIHSENTEYYVSEKENHAVFACTKRFLFRNSMPVIVRNPLTSELEQRIRNIINNEVTTKIINGGCSWHTYQTIRNALFYIKLSEWDDEYKKKFIVVSYSILNLFTTAVFSMSTVEQMVTADELQFGISSPFSRIEELRKLVKCANSLELQCAFIADALENLYNSILTDSPKYQALKQMVLRASGKKVAIIIPKAYYADILCKDTMFSRRGVYITTANQFDDSQSYDKIIVVGDFSGKRFDALKCKATSDIIVLLYECELHWFEKKKAKSGEI